MALLVRSAILKQAGYRVITSNDGEDAMTKFSAETIDLVLADHHLLGTSGTALTAEMKKLRPQTRFVILTGSPHLAEGSEHLDLVITKGTDPKDLLNSIARLLS